MLATRQWRRDATARRFAVWMAAGTAFLLALAAGDFFFGTHPFHSRGWLEIAGLFLLMCLLSCQVPAATSLNHSRSYPHSFVKSLS